MTNTRLLEIAITRANTSKKGLAEAIGLSTMGLYKKINNITEFKASEISKLAALLHLGDAERESIFFTQNVD